MRSWLVGVAVLLGGCFSPKPSPGAPCGAGSACPTGLVCAAGDLCQRTDQVLDGGGGDGDDGSDAPDAAPPTSCWAAWRSGAPVLSTPLPVAELNTTGDESDPALSGDGLTLYFTRGRGTGADIYSATRPDRQAPFGTAVAEAALDSSLAETKVSLSADGLVAIESSSRQAIFGQSDANLFEAARNATSAPFGTPSMTPFGAIDDTSPQLDPDLIGDGTVLYYSYVDQGAGTPQRIRRAARVSLAASFDPPIDVPIAGSAGAVADPVASPDERVLVYSSNVPSLDLYLATRAATTDAFVQVGQIPGVNSSVIDGDAELSRDGCELFFMSNRAGPGKDLYRSVVTPQ